MIKLSNLVLSLVFVVGILSLLGSLFVFGFSEFSLNYFASGVTDSGRQGGILPVLLNTAIIWFGSMLISSVFGVLIAIACFELGFVARIFSRFMLASLFLIAGIPSIVFGLMGNEIFVVRLNWGYSLIAGIMSVSMMMLPLVALSVFLGIKSIDPNLIKSVRSLSLPKFKAYTSVLRPAFSASLLAGLVMASGRILAETAALLFTSGYSDQMPESIFDSGRSLTVHIYDLMANVTGGEARAYAAASVLMILIFSINLILTKSVLKKA
jgi:phosphate transport system permease protein